jgi:hypothetical protein
MSRSQPNNGYNSIPKTSDRTVSVHTTLRCAVGSLETEIPGSGNVADVGEQCVYRARCCAILPDQSYGRMCSGHGLRRYCSCQIAPTCV